jgi:RHS repeat-associated protein
LHTVFDPAGRWIGDYDANGHAIQEAIWLGDQPVGLLAMIGGSTRLFHVEADALGTPRAVIDPTRGAVGTVVWRWDLSGEAFGNDKPDEDPDGDDTLFVLDMRYPGQQFDSATGFSYNYFRDYEASTGRYVQSDPIGLNGGISTYGYVGGNSLTRMDPTGLNPLVAVYRAGTTGWRIGESLYPFVQPLITRVVQTAFFPEPYNPNPGIYPVLMSSDSNVIPFRKKKVSDLCPAPGSGGGSWCESQQKKLFAQYTFVTGFSALWLQQDVRTKRIMVLDYNTRAIQHNTDCPSFSVPLIPLPGPSGI